VGKSAYLPAQLAPYCPTAALPFPPAGQARQPGVWSPGPAIHV